MEIDNILEILREHGVTREITEEGFLSKYEWQEKMKCSEHRIDNLFLMCHRAGLLEMKMTYRPARLVGNMRLTQSYKINLPNQNKKPKKGKK
jgi:hypothetical protein